MTLDDWSEEDTTHNDKLRVPAKDAGLLLVNLQLANVDWSEYKDEYESNTDDENDDENDDDSDDDNDHLSEPEPSMLHRYDGAQTDEDYSDGASSELPNVKYWIGLYAIEDIDYEAVMRKLDPAFGPKKPSSELMCRPQGRVPSDQTAAIAEAARLHPMRCRNNEDLHRGMFLTINTLDYEEEGILLVQLQWDEKVEGRSLGELAAAGTTAQTDVRRLPTSNSITLTRFNEIKAGYRPWKQNHKTFFAYDGPKSRHLDAYLGALDKTFQRCKFGSEIFLEGQTQFKTTDEGVVDDGQGLETAVDQHKGFVYQERFRATLCPDYFVYCGRKIEFKDVKAPVTLAKVDKDGKWTTMECSAGEAYATLCELVDGKNEWASTT